MSKQRRQALFQRVATESGGLPYDFLLRWFPGACTLTDVGVSDLRIWTAWALFGLRLNDLTDNEMEELDGLVQETVSALSSQGISMPSTSKYGVGMYRLSLDTMYAQHRPLLYYVATAAMECCASAAMCTVGKNFEPCRMTEQLSNVREIGLQF